MPVTYSIGTGFRLGLPYKGDLAYAREAGISGAIYKRDTLLTTTVAAADVIAGMSIPFLAPFPGLLRMVLVRERRVLLRAMR